MSYYAQIVNDLVTNVIVVSNDIADGDKFCTDLFGGQWEQTFIDTAGKNYAGIGYRFDSVKQNFIAPQPYASWTLDSNDIWQPPTPQPDGDYYWNEEQQTWVQYD